MFSGNGKHRGDYDFPMGNNTFMPCVGIQTVLFKTEDMSYSGLTVVREKGEGQYQEFNFTFYEEVEARDALEKLAHCLEQMLIDTRKSIVSMEDY